MFAIEGARLNHVITVALVIVACCSLTLAATGILSVLALGTLSRELRTDRASVAVVRERILKVESDQSAALAAHLTEMRRLSRVICEHVTQVNRMHKACGP